MTPSAEHEHVAGGQPFPVVVLVKGAAGHLTAPLPNNVAVPVDQADFFVRVDTHAAGNLTMHRAAIHTRGLNADDPALTVDRSGIDHRGGIPSPIPCMDDISIHVDEAAISLPAGIFALLARCGIIG